MPVLIEGTDLPLWGMEIDTEREKEKFKAWSAGECCAAVWHVARPCHNRINQ